MKVKILVILASTRPERNGEKVASWFFGITRLRSDEADFQLVDLRDWNLPYYDNPLPPMIAQLEGRTKEWAELISAADGFVIVTPEYNHGYPAVLKSHLDAVYYPWNRKPVAFVSYGGVSAGLRAAEQLRQVAIELQMAPIREQLGIPMVWAAFDESGKLRDGESLRPLATNLLDDLLWWARALKHAREAGVKADSEQEGHALAA